MAEIVDLAIERGSRLGRERSAEQSLGPAQIVLYTGVYYSREEPPPPQPDKPKKKRRTKRKNS